MAGAESFVLKAERFLTEECVRVGGRNVSLPWDYHTGHTAEEDLESGNEAVGGFRTSL